MLLKEIRETWWKLGIGLMVFCTLALAGPGLFWYMENNADMKLQFQALPPEMVGRLTDYQSLVHSNWFGQNLLQMGTIFAVILASGAIAGETSKRTLEFLLSKPISRFSVLIAKVVVGLSVLGVATLVASLLIYPASLILGYDVSLSSLVLAAILGWLGLSVIFSLTLLLSTLFDEVIKTAAFSLVIALVLAVPSWFQSISRFSIYNHMQDFAAFQQGSFPFGDAAFLLVTFAVLVSGSHLIFRAKEL